MLELVYTGDKAVTTASAFTLLYEEAWDAYFYFQAGNLRKVFRDGTACAMGLAPYSNISIVGRAEGRHAYFDGLSSSQIFGADTLTGNYNPTDLVGTATAGDVYFRLALVDEKNDILVVPYSANRIYIKRFSTGATLRTITATLPSPSVYWDAVHYSGNSRAMAINHATGFVCFFNYLTGDIELESKVGACIAAGFDYKRNNILTVGTDKFTRNYVLEIVPSALSNPVFYGSPVAIVNKHCYKVTTRLTGSAGEGIQGYVVTWILVAGYGELLLSESETDEDGYATNYYITPESLTGSETITVAVVH